MFCKYCGKEILEGGTCTCASAQGKGTTVGQNSNIGVLFNWCICFVKDYFMNPIGMMKKAALGAYGRKAYIFGVLNLFLLWLSAVGVLSFLNDGEKAKVGIAFVLILLIEKLMFSTMCFFVGKKSNVTFEGVLQAICVMSIQQSICLLLVFLFGVFEFVTLVSIIICIMSITELIGGIFILEQIFENNINFAYWAYLVITIIFIVIAVFSVKGVAKVLLEEFTDSLSWLL